MTQSALFDPYPTSASSEDRSLRLAVGDTFTFTGLHGQEPLDQRMPGSGSVGWVLELHSLSPWGSLSVFCYPEGDPDRGRFVSVALSDAVAMIRTGAWTPLG